MTYLLERYFTVLIPILGLFVGSFANVLIYRIPRGEEWVRTPSHCASCGHRLSWVDMVPVLSYIFLRGRCRFCKAKISFRYPAVEIINGVLWLVCVRSFGLTTFLPVALLVSTSLLALSFIDWDTQEIPDGIHVFLLVTGVLWNVYAFFAGLDVWLSNLIGFFCVSLLLLIIAVVSRGGMGGGDIKLMAVCGLIIGWQRILLALGLGAILGTLIMLPVYLITKTARSKPLPFGPFLSAGVYISMIYGDSIISWYLSVFLQGAFR